MRVSREQVYEVLDGERDYQDEKWGPTPSQGQHSPTEYLVYMKDYLDEAMSDATRGVDPEATEQVLHDIRKITAMGVACMEQHGAPARESH